jgi:hypothetical protein
MKDFIFLAVDFTLTGDKYKVYKSVKEAREDKNFLFDELYECRLMSREEQDTIYFMEKTHETKM